MIKILKRSLLLVIWLAGMQASYVVAESVEERTRAAGLPSTQASDLMRYAQDDDWRVRLIVAKRQSTPANILILLSRDPSWRVRSALAHNLRAPRNALIPLVNDESVDVRLSMAHCGYTPPDLIVKLLNDPELKVRKQAVVNLNVPLKVLKGIAAGDSEIADTAKAILEKRLSEGEQ